MDIISYGVASKASKEEVYTRNTVLGEDITSTFPTMKERIDSINDSFAEVTKQADKMILQNAVNIMKSHAKLNAIARTKKYNMHQMIFDDLLDTIGIDTGKGKYYVHSIEDGIITAEATPDPIDGEEKEIATVITRVEQTDFIPNQIVLVVEEIGNVGTYYVSRTNGDVWEEIVPESLHYFHDRISEENNQLRLKAELPEGTKLLNYALSWA